MEPVFQLTLQELDKVIGLIRGITPDVDTRPLKVKHKIEQLANYFEAHRDILQKMKAASKK